MIRNVIESRTNLDTQKFKEDTVSTSIIKFNSDLKANKRINIFGGIKGLGKLKKDELNVQLNKITQKIIEKAKEEKHAEFVISHQESQFKQTEMLIKELEKPKLNRKQFCRRIGSINGLRDLRKIKLLLKNMPGFIKFCSLYITKCIIFH